jgi:tRNA/rRNA methyltransferase
MIAYDWRQALGGFEVAARTIDASLADVPSVQGLLDHWQQALEAVDFLDPAAPRKLMPRLNQAINRAALRQEEVHVLRGVARAVIKAAGERGS